MVASEKGYVEVVKSLIQAKANINHTNKVGTHTILLDAHPALLCRQCRLVFHSSSEVTRISFVVECIHRTRRVIPTWQIPLVVTSLF